MAFSRSLGESELSYFLPSRGDGVNDMYLHLGFRAPPRLVNARRVELAWAILRGRHPLLASSVAMEPCAYDTARFVYTPPASPNDALLDAQSTFFLETSSKDTLIDSYLNGPRTLSPTRLSALILASPSLATPPAPATPPATPRPRPATPDICEFDILICAVHFLGDGMALHTFANDLFKLLASPDDAPLSDTALHALLEDEWTHRWSSLSAESPLPPTLEARLSPVAFVPPHPLAAFQRIAHDVAFRRAQERPIGAQTFPRTAADKAKPRHTVVRSVAFDSDTTRGVLARCKAEGVSIAHVFFALCNVAWARMPGTQDQKEQPMMMYSALNLRPYLVPCDTSYWFLAVGYFNVVLPTFLPNADSTAIRATFWHRARSAKRQCVAAAKAPLLVPYTERTARERGARARKFAALDDGIRVPPASRIPSPPLTPVSETETAPSAAQIAKATEKARETARPPSNALVGLSLLGNLDTTYKHTQYPSVTLHTLTTGSRQRAGALLVFGYTFAGKLWVSIGWDEVGLGGEQGVLGEWWRGVVGGVGEFCTEGS